MACAAVVVALTVAVGIQAVRIHQTYGEWGLVEPDTPARIDALGRHYDRGDVATDEEIPNALDFVGRTSSGSEIFAPRVRPGVQPVVIFVRDDVEQLWKYALVGGPLAVIRFARSSARSH